MQRVRNSDDVFGERVDTNLDIPASEANIINGIRPQDFMTQEATSRFVAQRAV